MIICDLCGRDASTIDKVSIKYGWLKWEYFDVGEGYSNTILCALCNDERLDEIAKVKDPINEKWKDKIRKAVDNRNNQKAKYDTSK